MTHASRARVAGLALLAVVVAGCGNATTPADAAPELAQKLTRVDRAVAGGDEQQIRQRVETLVGATEAARDAGRIDAAQADRILTAADALLARLPAEEPPPPPPTASQTPEPEEDEHDEDHDEDHDQGEDEED